MYRICKRCVMDTSDPDIFFDSNGYCNHCTSAINTLHKLTFTGNQGQQRLSAEIDRIKKEGHNKPFDCIIGLSGGVDSSYLAYKCKSWSLRPLLFHVDGGWNTPESKHNVQAIADYLKSPLQSYTVNWDEMRDLQRAFLAAGVPNQDIPQDHLFFATLFKVAKQYNLLFWLSGSNYISESILPSAWGGYAMDTCHLISIHKQFGTIPLKTYPLLSYIEYCKYYAKIGRKTISRVDLLNFIPYNPYQARIELQNHCDWKSYGDKHNESIFTRFFQNYFLPRRFGFDKRRAHLSSLIVANQMSREKALDILQANAYSNDLFEQDKKTVLSRLCYSEAEFEQLINMPLHQHYEYKNSKKIMTLAWKLKTLQNALVLLKNGDFDTFISKIYTKFFNKKK